MTSSSYRILITGEASESLRPLPREAAGRLIEWTRLPLLEFERLAVDATVLERAAKQPYGWIIFASPRAVQFWSETLLENGVDFPLETQVACIGERTAEAAANDGFTPDFYPLEAGTEGFLREFEQLIALGDRLPSVLIPAAESGRQDLRERLQTVGCVVTWVPLYRTRARVDLGNEPSAEQIAAFDAIVFTSPSSVDAYLGRFEIPQSARVLSLGKFTGEHLRRRGVDGVKLLPEGDFAKIGEVLC